jgi:1,2-diacylglycerol 3-beta-glucosyltransferase
MLIDVLRLVLAAVLASQVLLVLYLLALTLAAIVTRPHGLPRAPENRRFAILVPAHNEEAVLGRLLTSLNALDYPPEAFEVCVVADNCDDGTAAIARSFGVRVYERFDTTAKAKGFALRWLLQQLDDEGRVYDAFIIVDADSVLAPNFLEAMNARLASGSHAIQAYYSVLNAAESSVAGLRYAALAAVHYLRPLGRSRFNLSAGLKGNGMCFSAATLKHFGWRWFTLAEDVEFHLALLAEGIRVEFAPETWVKADMPITLEQASSQNSRWERGRLQLIRENVPGLLLAGLRRRSWVQIDAAAEQLIPPLSVPFASCVGLLLITAVLGQWSLAAVAVACLIGYGLYLAVALALVGAPMRVYLMLCTAPVYIAWKVSLYGRSFVGGRTSPWVRTPRTATTAPTR